MFCPSCGSEYREGFSSCADCEVPLVDSPPAETHPDPGDVETVFASSDPVLLVTAKSLLDEAGIPYLTRGEGIQDLFGMGRLGTGFSVVAGAVEIQVGAHRAHEAADLLYEAGLEDGEGGNGMEGVTEAELEEPAGDDE